MSAAAVAGTLTYADLATRVKAATPRLGSVRLVCVDGPAGSGKSTLAARLATRLGAGTSVLHLDDVYEGWAGLAGVAQRVARDVLAPLARDEPAVYRTWDWTHSRWGIQARLTPAPVLLIEGCGAGDAVLAAYASLLLWVEAPAPLRLSRGIDRDGAAMRDEWLRWTALEEQHFQAEGTRSRADLLIDGTLGDEERLTLLPG